MGGPNSGRWRNYAPRTVVEQCSILDMRVFSTLLGILRPKVHQHGYFQQRYVSAYGEQETMLVLFELDSRDMTRPFLELHHRSPDTRQEVIYDIELQVIKPYFGGTRLYLGCPIRAGGMPCNRRAEKLYLPAYGTVYGCRCCYQLSYISSQTSHCGMPW